jgi:transcription initiation factor TFIIH subunit 2
MKSIIQMEGDPSLQNVLTLSLNILRHVPEYGSKELLILFNSLKTRDPSDINITIELAKRANLRVNIVNLSAELYVCKKIAEETNGAFTLLLMESHLI